MRILNVAFPFAPVQPDAVGGAEQILSVLDHALVEAGHVSHVLACEGSRTAGRLHAIPRVEGEVDGRARETAHAQYRCLIARIVEHERIDLIHLHGIDFTHYIPERTPALATLHLPLSWYDETIWSLPCNIRLHCVSKTQHATGWENRLTPPIENGVPAVSRNGVRRRGYCVMLARICPEKGVHLAIDATKGAEVPLLIAGQVYPYRTHRAYFETEVAPRLDARRRFIGPVQGLAKTRLLAGARALLAPSSAPETSSLVAMEAMSAGTPVIAFRAGALADIVEHGRTGFLVEDVAGMAKAIRSIGEIDSLECHEAAARRFSQERMIGDYFETYRGMIAETAR